VRDWGISIALHVLLILVLLALHVDLTVMEDFVEVSFTAITARTPEPVRTPQTAARVQRRVSPPAQSQAAAESTPVPKRQMLEVEEPEFITAQRQDVASTLDPALIDNTTMPGVADTREQLNLPGQSGMDRREAVGSSPMAVGDKMLAPVGASTPGAVGQPNFEIEWTGTAREKTSGSLPPYPEGANENRVIKLSFMVNPAGEVTNAIPVQKGQALMENAAIRALKSWRFNPLESSAPQVMQRGVIAFHFRVR